MKKDNIDNSVNGSDDEVPPYARQCWHKKNESTQYDLDIADSFLADVLCSCAQFV